MIYISSLYLIRPLRGSDIYFRFKRVSYSYSIIYKNGLDESISMIYISYSVYRIFGLISREESRGSALGKLRGALVKRPLEVQGLLVKKAPKV